MTISTAGNTNTKQTALQYEFFVFMQRHKVGYEIEVIAVQLLQCCVVLYVSMVSNTGKVLDKMFVAFYILTAP